MASQARRGGAPGRLVGSIVRTLAALALVVFCVDDWEALSARAQFAALPDYDYAAEAEKLRAERRLSEALLVLQAGLEQVEPGARPELQALKAEIEDERDHWLNRLQDAGRGALTGTGTSGDAVAGAIVADLFVFGDLRDLVIQGQRYLRDGEPDMVIVGLSTAGLVLTGAAGADLGAAVLKFARRMGALTRNFARTIADAARRAARTGRGDELVGLARHAGELARHAGPTPALAIFRHVEDAADLQRAARLASAPQGAFALWVGGAPALRGLAAGGDDAQALLLRAARKGQAGVAFAARRAPALLRPHPLLGLLKSAYKGNVPRWLTDWVGQYSAALFGLVLAWLGFEFLLLLQRARALI